MKKLFLFVFLMCTWSVFAELPTFLPEIKAGYFWPQEKVLREIYHQGGAIGQVELNVSLFQSCSHTFYAFGDVSYFRKTGESLSLHEHTRIEIIPISAGFKYAKTLSQWDCVSIYVGAGCRYFFVNIHNDSDFVKRKVHKDGLGGVFKVGSLIEIYPCLFIDIFGEYGLRKIYTHDTRRGKLERFDIHVGGFVLGAGVGYGF